MGEEQQGARCVKLRLFSSTVLNNTLDPVWDEEFSVSLCLPITSLYFEVREKDTVGSDFLGGFYFPISPTVLLGREVKDCVALQNTQQRLNSLLNLIPLYRGHLSFRLQFAAAKPQALCSPVQPSYFDEHDGHVTLYSNADVDLVHARDFAVQGSALYGKRYNRRRCWVDLYRAIQAASKYIYILCWAFNPHIKLDRHLEEAEEVGQLLLRKAAEGVEVAILQWEDATSYDNALLKTKGIMNTFDKLTRAYFRGTKVRVALAPRLGRVPRQRKKDGRALPARAEREGEHVLEATTARTLFSHHQKLVVCDEGHVEHAGGKYAGGAVPDNASAKYRRPVAFLGGLDITRGRWDDQQHQLFATLDTVHANDFHNKNFRTHPFGPRQPWHDIHAAVRGQAAVDALDTFQERWAAQGDGWALRDVQRCWWHVADPGGKWRVQMFRSIDERSVKFGRAADSNRAVELGLHSVRGRLVERGVLGATVAKIRSAERMLYMENQFFVGSSPLWPNEYDVKAENPVPVEIARKIATKILAGERFAAYIVIPMFPEGLPAAGPNQHILYLQRCTIAAMYRVVADAIQEAGLAGKAHPQDYLNFFCLGKREAPESPPQNAARLGQLLRRYQQLTSISDLQLPQHVLQLLHAYLEHHSPESAVADPTITQATPPGTPSKGAYSERALRVLESAVSRLFRPPGPLVNSSSSSRVRFTEPASSSRPTRASGISAALAFLATRTDESVAPQGSASTEQTPRSRNLGMLLPRRKRPRVEESAANAPPEWPPPRVLSPFIDNPNQPPPARPPRRPKLRGRRKKRAKRKGSQQLKTPSMSAPVPDVSANKGVGDMVIELGLQGWSFSSAGDSHASEDLVDGGRWRGGEDKASQPADARRRDKQKGPPHTRGSHWFGISRGAFRSTTGSQLGKPRPSKLTLLTAADTASGLEAEGSEVPRDHSPPPVTPDLGDTEGPAVELATAGEAGAGAKGGTGASAGLSMREISSMVLGQGFANAAGGGGSRSLRLPQDKLPKGVSNEVGGVHDDYASGQAPPAGGNSLLQRWESASKGSVDDMRLGMRPSRISGALVWKRSGSQGPRVLPASRPQVPRRFSNMRNESRVGRLRRCSTLESVADQVLYKAQRRNEKEQVIQALMQMYTILQRNPSQLPALPQDAGETPRGAATNGGSGRELGSTSANYSCWGRGKLTQAKAGWRQTLWSRSSGNSSMASQPRLSMLRWRGGGAMPIKDQLLHTRRQPIYVHSKFFVVDDAYVFVGSANINERSLTGTRDTELSFGAYQPAHSGGGTGMGAADPRGEVHAFRMSLWVDYLGPATGLGAGGDHVGERRTPRSSHAAVNGGATMGATRADALHATSARASADTRDDEGATANLGGQEESVQGAVATSDVKVESASSSAWGLTEGQTKLQAVGGLVPSSQAQLRSTQNIPELLSFTDMSASFEGDAAKVKQATQLPGLVGHSADLNFKEQLEVFGQPHSLECVHLVRRIAERNWQQYAADKCCPTSGFMLTYPIHVGYDGSVTVREGFERFPDTTADVLGTKSSLYPDLLTT